MMISSNGVELCAEAYGPANSPAIILVTGTGASMLAWDADFCTRLATGPRFVIRYDSRDTGRSTTYPPGRPAYNLHDLASDVIGILDGLKLARAHLVGESMGGMICQLAALAHPERVVSLTLISSSPGGAGPDHPDLPPTPLHIQQQLHNTPWPDWSDRAQVLEYMVGLDRVHTGHTRQLNEAARYALAGRVFDRAIEIESSMTNHYYVEPVDPWRTKLHKIAAPTLVVHGDQDPIYPLQHGEALTNDIPGSRLLVLNRAGHGLTRPDWDVVVPAIIAHTQAHMENRCV